MFKRIKEATASTSFVYGLIIYSSFIFHFYNIGYNSPSGDEATYITTGLNSILRSEWSLVNTATWFGGHPFFYPTLTAIAYTLGGIEGSRILNVLFSVICLFFVGNLTLELSLMLNKNKRYGLAASLIAITLAGFSEVTGYVSRLATYDMPSFTFLTASLYFLVKGMTSQKVNTIAKRFLTSAVLLALAFTFKYIVAIYVPVVWALAYFYTGQQKLNKDLRKLLIAYFVFPASLLIGLVTLTQVTFLISYVSSQLVREASTYTDIIREFAIEMWAGTIFWVLGFVLLILKKKWKVLLLLLSFASVMVIFHFASVRLATWDKHIFLILLPMSVMAGLGMSDLLQHKLWRKVIVGLLLIYIGLSLNNSKRYNSTWPNYTKAYTFLTQNLQQNDTLLAEESSSMLLPFKVTTFDWFSYKGHVNSPAYREALIDGYFTYIQLNEGYPYKSQAYTKIETLVQKESRGSYNQVYKDDYFTVYKLKF